MDEYTERVSGLYKIIHSFSKGEDVSKLRKQYIDRMDEIMFYDTDFDYDKFKEDKKRVERLSKGLVYSATYNDKANEYRYRLKESKADKLESMSDEQSVEEAKLAEIKANVNYIDKLLKANIGWDTDMTEERELLFRAEQEHIMNFLNEYANYKNIK
jgi:esterase/lipase superfamily enzyme